MSLVRSRLAKLGVIALVALLSGCRSVGVQREGSPALNAVAESPRFDEVRRLLLDQLKDPKVTPEDDTRIRTIDLDAILERVEQTNPTIATAEEAVRGAVAERTLARSMFLPHLTAGANYRWHSGKLMNATGLLVDSDLHSWYVGAGAEGRGAGTIVVPGVRCYFHLGDLFLEPQVAELRVASRTQQFEAVADAIDLETATAYWALATAQGRVLAWRKNQTELNGLVDLARSLVKAGQGREGDTQRVIAELRLSELEMNKAIEDRDVAAADLSRLLSLDAFPRTREVLVSSPLAVDAALSLSELIDEAVRHRPELRARQAESALAQVRVRQETVRPWLPTVSLGFSAGGYGGGRDNPPATSAPLQPRTDLDLVAVWNLRNLGLGQRAHRREAESHVRQTQFDERAELDDIRRQVAEAHAAVQAKSEEIVVVKRRLEALADGYRRDVERARNLQIRPIELLDSLAQLASARVELIRAVNGHSLAQFQLALAVGR